MQKILLKGRKLDGGKKKEEVTTNQYLTTVPTVNF